MRDLDRLTARPAPSAPYTAVAMAPMSPLIARTRRSQLPPAA
ncbi:hypothetical protein [Streptomyces sp. NPDC055912]